MDNIFSIVRRKYQQDSYIYVSNLINSCEGMRGKQDPCFFFYLLYVKVTEYLHILLFSISVILFCNKIFIYSLGNETQMK